jgi:hypothetical protein
MNFNWNTYWDVATSQTDEGWFAEMRIPFSSLRFQDRDGKVEMGLIAYRFLAAKNERHIFPDIPPNWRLGMAKPSMAQDVMLEGVYSKRPVYVTPYAVGGIDQVHALNSTETAYHLDSGRTHEIGVDVKYSVTDNLSLDATVNTDFAQVEADDQQLNLTRYLCSSQKSGSFFKSVRGFSISASRVVAVSFIVVVSVCTRVNPCGFWEALALGESTSGTWVLSTCRLPKGIVCRRKTFPPCVFVDNCSTSIQTSAGS